MQMGPRPLEKSCSDSTPRGVYEPPIIQCLGRRRARVARGLRRCFGMKTAVATSFVENEVGRLLEDLILQGGVSTDLIRWEDFDGIGGQSEMV